MKKPHETRGKKPDLWADDKAVAMVLEGASIKEAAEASGRPSSTVRSRIAARVSAIKSAAAQVIESERLLKNLQPLDRITAMDYAAKLRAINSNLLDAAHNGSKVSARLSGIAAQQADQVSEESPMDSAEQLQAIAGLTKLANESATIGMALAKASQGKPEQAAQPTAGLITSAEDAARAYKNLLEG